MKIERIYTKELNKHDKPSTLFTWRDRKVLIKDYKTDTILCDMPTVEVPMTWSQQATDILAHKYLRKSGLKGSYEYIHEEDVPKWLQRKRKVNNPSNTVGRKLHIHDDMETSLNQVANRLAGAWTYTAWKEGYFGLVGFVNNKTCNWTVEQEKNAKAFYDELYYIICYQIAAPNSPQWFNTGLWWAYGISNGTNQHYRYNKKTNTTIKVPNEETYKYPQTSACYILGIEDTLLGDNGIMDTLKKEAAIFKYGSGSGINFSTLRGKDEPLTGGGKSSGMMSFLKIFDTNAGSIKSGGTTRRAARMAIVNHDHPEVLDFIHWKSKEELKVNALSIGSRVILHEEVGEDGIPEGKFSSPDDKLLVDTLQSLTTDYESEAYNTVSGQNANNSISVTNQFMEDISTPYKDIHETPTRQKEIEHNQEIWKQLCEAAYQTGDPGLQFRDTINKWHTIPKVSPINASNPCSEYMFIDDSACNLASINLYKFKKQAIKQKNKENPFNYKEFLHVTRLLTIVLDVTIEMSSFPDKQVAENSWKYRPLGLGYANLGGLLMSLGIPYASKEGRRLASEITAHMHFMSQKTSQELAKQLEPLYNYTKHIHDIDSVSHQHVKYMDKLNIEALFDIHPNNPVRNAQLTLLAPTGTIGLVMDCATTGIEPDFSLIKYKKLAGGGTMKIVNPLIEEGLRSLGFNKTHTDELLERLHQDGDFHNTQFQDKPVFACANDISYQDHIAMMTAVQPFLSGAISKTVNLPNEATVEDISNAYKLAHESGLKSIAIYRDGCKFAQPLTKVETKPKSQTKEQDDTMVNQQLSFDTEKVEEKVKVIDSNTKVHTNKDKIPTLPQKQQEVKPIEFKRKSLPNRRRGFTQKVKLNGFTIYLRTGEYEDGRLGEIFINVGQAGSDIQSLMNDFAVAISISLQYGTPLEAFSKQYIGSKSSKGGFVTGSETLKMCSSIMDYVFRELIATYGDKHSDGTIEDSTVTLTTTNEKPQQTEEKPKVDVVPFKPVTLSSGYAVQKTKERSDIQYTGDSCPSCGSLTLQKNGTCHVCTSCGETTGCS